MDINYQYNFEQKARGISYRSGADPVIVNHQGEYFLFCHHLRRLVALERPRQPAGGLLIYASEQSLCLIVRADYLGTE